ncbi:OsmC family protein [Terrabacter sp. 2RAF25]|uniref:OsmC family protein n=1 Tax=Terrabacter sp. 2RAF25 TaxID=3232998 RepID=UPI003F99F598
MNRDELRAAQTPLKQRYRDEPASARTPVSATATFDVPPTVEVTTWAGPVRAGLHRATGGDGADACSGDMLMEALVACAGVTLHTVAVAFGVDLRDVTVRAEATFDVRGTLGIDRDVPVGVIAPHVVAEVTTDADDATLDRLATATERYCVVGQSLRRPPTFTVSRRDPGADPAPAAVR